MMREIGIQCLPADRLGDKCIDDVYRPDPVTAEIEERGQGVTEFDLDPVSRLTALQTRCAFRYRPIDSGVCQAKIEHLILRSRVIDAYELVDDDIAQIEKQHERRQSVRVLIP